MARNIVLTGLMGSGKSTIAQILSERLGFKLVDTDELIEYREKKSISHIFADSGEAYFRKTEAEIVKEISKSTNVIISTGGGVVENQENIDNLKINGVLFYLYAPPEELYRRVKSQNHRPLLLNSDPEGTLTQLLNKREKFYTQAHYTINTSGKSTDEIADEITEIYKKYEI